MSRHITGATWDDAPHLTSERKATLFNSIPPTQRDARTRGIPQLGAGAIWPVEESTLRVRDFEIPKHFARAWALDSGITATGAVGGAWDREADIVYIHWCYQRGYVEPIIHSEAVKSHGEWVPGVGDVAAIGKMDGEQFLSIYRRLGLTIDLADKAVETGITEVWIRMSTGRLKVFASCSQWFDQWRLYRRNERGVIIKVNDHLMDPTRYLVKNGLQRAITPPVPTVDDDGGGGNHGNENWMQ